MNKVTIKKVRYIIKPRFYIICALMMLLLISIIISVTSGTKNDISIGDETKTITTTSKPIVLVISTPKPVEKVKLRYGFTDKDIYLLAQVLCGSKNTSGDGEYDIDFKKEINYYEVGKVLNVIMNRVRSPKFPNTVREVVLQTGQFSVIPCNLKKIPSEVALRTVKEWCSAYDNYSNYIQVVPKSHLYFSGNGFINKTR